MTCPDCQSASERLHHGFTQGCVGCCARAAARSPQFAAAQKAGRQDRAYRALLEQFGLTHEQVREAHQRDAATRGESACNA